MKKASKYIIGALIGALLCFLLTGDTRIQEQETPMDAYNKRQAKRHSIIAAQAVVIDNLRKTRTVIIVRRDGTRVDINRTLNRIDSLATPPILSDSLIDQALLWAEQQNDSL